MPNFTTEDLTLFMYNEMSKPDKAGLEKELQSNWALREKLQVLKESAQRVQNMQLQSPRRQTVKAIMEYAAQSSEVSS
ncbi:MAG TPA: hypothetical protein VG738_01425 [Chitinophagaceae bacterium]|nr:hypothetical protein [Chitinophagaceae bacterium]